MTNAILRGLTPWTLALTAVLAMLSVRAEEPVTVTWYYPKAIASTDPWKSETGAQYWKNLATDQAGSGALNSSDNYWIRGGYRLRGSGSFAGGGLTIGDLDNPDYNAQLAMYANCSVLNGALNLAVGYVFHSTQSKSAYSLTGPGQITVLSPKDRPFGISSAQNATTLTLKQKLVGEAGTGIVIGGHFDGTGFDFGNGGGTNMSFKTVDLSEYKGDIRVISDLPLISQTMAKTYFAVEPGTCPGSVECDAGTEFQLNDMGEFSVSALTLHGGSRLRVTYNSTSETASVIRVSHAFAIPEDEGVVQVRFSALPAARTDDRPLVLPLLVVPDTQELDPSRFVCSAADDLPFDSCPQFRVDEDKAAGTKTLVAVILGKGHLVTSDSSVYSGSNPFETYTSALTEEKAASWSDGNMPHEWAVYEFGNQDDYGMTIRTPYERADDYVFPGKLLRTIGTSATFVLADNTKTTVDFDLTSPLSQRVVKQKDPTVDGTIFLGADMTWSAWNDSELTIASRLSGSGNLSTLGIAGTGSPHATLVLANDNSAWTGTISMDQKKNGTDIPGEGSAKHQKIRVLAGNNLGGKLEEFDPRALFLVNYSEVIISNDVTLAADLNRGVAISNAATFNVAANCTLACNWPVAFCGTLIKNSAGTLALGARSLFLSATGDVVETPDPTMPVNALRLDNGAIKVLAYNCLNGVTFTYGTNAKYAKDIILPFNPSDANLKRYGFYNVASDEPFAVGQTISFKLADVDADALEAARLTDEGYKQGLITVKTTAAKNVEDNLVVEKVKGLRLIREDDAETETTTFSLYGKKEGVLLIVR